MKKILNILSAIAITFGTVSCNDEFLDRLPKGDVAEDNAFTTFETSKAYLQSLYGMISGAYTWLQGPSFDNSTSAVATSTRDLWSGLITNKAGFGAVYNIYADSRADVINATDGAWSNPYAFILRANILLEHIDDPDCSDAERTYLETVGRFFRAYAHYALVLNFGDCLWVDHRLGETSPELYAPRDSRLYVADKIYNELKWCIENCPDEIAEENTINSDVVRALMSRFTLFEGTWRKYHNVNESECDAKGWIKKDALLDACIKYSAELVENHPNLYTGDPGAPDNYPGKGWGQLHTTNDLKGAAGVLLYVRYEPLIKCHMMGHHLLTASNQLELPQQTIDLYLTKDGLPIHNANVKYYDYANGEYTPADPYDYANCDIYKTFRNRDPRMMQTVEPPYYVDGASQAFWYRTHPEANDGKWMEYLNQFPSAGVLQQIEGDENYYVIPHRDDDYHYGYAHKALPAAQWEGKAVYNVPNINQVTVNAKNAFDAGEIGYRALSTGYQTSYGGYTYWKQQANWDKQNPNQQLNVADKPVFHVEEAMLNYAEAYFERNGSITADIIDKTINKLRDRAEVGRMNLGMINDSFDPDKPAGNDDGTPIDPVLWEIRRERLIELMGEGFSWDDIRRWKMAEHFVNRQPYGCWVEGADKWLKISNANLRTGVLEYTVVGGKIVNGSQSVDATGLAAQGNKGHLYYFQKTNVGWKQKYYLRPLPSSQTLLNPNLLPNNPGWD